MAAQRLLMLLLLLAARELSAQLPRLRLHSAAPATAWVSGGTTVTLRGRGFGTPTARALCRIGPAPGGGSTVVQASGFLPDAHAELTFPATVSNDTTASCVLPPVVVAGPVVLSLSPDGAAWPAPFWYSESLEITYADLVDVTLGKRPYFAEPSGSLLLYSHPALRRPGTRLRIRASLPCAHNERSWSWSHEPAATASSVAELPMPGLSSLPSRINADLRVEITVSGGPHHGASVTKSRRLMRHAEPAPAGVEPVQVDHLRRSIAVNGQLFTGTGWFLDGHRPLALQNLTAVTAEIRRVAAHGVNQVLLYSLPRHAPGSVRAFMDEMARLDVKVWVDLQPLGFSGGGGMNYTTRLHSAQWRKGATFFF